MKIAKLIAVPAATIALSLATVTTFTGCEDALGTTDTVSIEKLGVGFIEGVEVLTDSTAQINVSGSFVKKEKFAGFAFLSAPAVGDTTDQKNIIATYFANPADSSAETSWNKEISSPVLTIEKDTEKTWYVAAFNDDMEMGYSIPAFFYARELTADQSLTVFDTKGSVDGIGIDIDGMDVAIKKIEGGMANGNPVEYATNLGGDVVVEKNGSDLLVTPIGGAVLFAASDADQFTDEEIEVLYDSSYAVTGKIKSVKLADHEESFLVFSQGKSVRDAIDGDLVALEAGQNYYMISSAYNVARLVVESVTSPTDATFNVYRESGMNDGLQLRSAN